MIRVTGFYSLIREPETANDMTSRNSLTPEDINRYCRQIKLEEAGIEGQERIKAASDLVVGTTNGITPML